jgi:hypothetical protein
MLGSEHHVAVGGDTRLRLTLLPVEKVIAHNVDVRAGGEIVDRPT